ncbi:MaoC/PaaZ C-terminal domain-containing protein [Corynebacterium phoceense]
MRELDRLPDMNALYPRLVASAARRGPRSGDPEGVRVRDVTVDPAQLARYARATGMTLRDEAPITFPFVLAFPLVMDVMATPEFPFAPLGAVHIANSIRQSAPLRVGETYDIEVTLERTRPHKRGTLVDMRTVFFPSGERSEPIGEQTSVFLGKGKPPTGEPEGGRLVGEGETSASVAEWRFTRADVRDYAEASGDRNPIHVSLVGAKAFGFPAPIAHGMLLAARMAAWADARREFDIDFYKPVVLPARVSLHAGDVLELRRGEKLHARARAV